MISLEQVKLLESKVTRAIDYVQKVTEENSSLRGKLDSYQKRIDELEVLIQQFKEEQGRIEDGILSALDRLNQFEDALERTIVAEPPEDIAPAIPESPPVSTLEPEPAAEPRQGRGSPSVPAAENEDSAKSSEELDIF